MQSVDGVPKRVHTGQVFTECPPHPPLVDRQEQSVQIADGWEWRQRSRLLSRGGDGPSTAKSPPHGESPRACDPIVLAPSITTWRAAYRELAKDIRAVPSCPPIPIRSC